MLFISIFAFYFSYYKKNISDSLIITLATIYSAVLIFSIFIQHFNVHIFSLIVILFLSKITYDSYATFKIHVNNNLEQRCLIVFIALVCVILYFGLSREQLIWDEYAQWAYSVKYLTNYGWIPSSLEDAIGHGGVWYPWGLAIYSFSVSYPLINYSSTSPVIINCILLIAVYFLLNINKKIIWISLIYFFTLIIFVTGNGVFIGYADFSQSLIVAIAILYALKISEQIKRDNRAIELSELSGFACSLILLVSVKESGKYILAILFLTWALVFASEAIRTRNFAKICCAYLPAVLLAFLWTYKLSFISERSSRDIGIATNQNLENLGSFFFSAYEQCLSLPRLFTVPLLLLLILYALKARFRDVGPSNFKFITIFSIIYIIFIIAAFIFSFGTIEFVKANSFTRYIELISVLFTIILFEKIIAFDYLIKFYNTISYLVFILLIWLAYNVSSNYKNIWEKNDIYLTEVSSLIYKKVGLSGVYYVDYATYGLHPIMINYFYPKSKILSYLPVSIYKDDHLPEIIINDKNIIYIIIIAETSRIHCYEKSSLAYTISFKNPNNLSYVVIPKVNYYETIDQSCLKK